MSAHERELLRRPFVFSKGEFEPHGVALHGACVNHIDALRWLVSLDRPTLSLKGAFDLELSGFIQRQGFRYRALGTIELQGRPV